MSQFRSALPPEIFGGLCLVDCYHVIKMTVAEPSAMMASSCSEENLDFEEVEGMKEELHEVEWSSFSTTFSLPSTLQSLPSSTRKICLSSFLNPFHCQHLGANITPLLLCINNLCHSFKSRLWLRCDTEHCGKMYLIHPQLLL